MHKSCTVPLDLTIRFICCWSMNMGETPIRSTNLYVPEDTFSYPTFYLVLITTLSVLVQARIPLYPLWRKKELIWKHARDWGDLIKQYETQCKRLLFSVGLISAGHVYFVFGYWHAKELPKQKKVCFAVTNYDADMPYLSVLVKSSVLAFLCHLLPPSLNKCRLGRHLFKDRGSMF